MERQVSRGPSPVPTGDMDWPFQQQVMVLGRITDQVKGWGGSLQRLLSALQGLQVQGANDRDQLQHLQNMEAQLRRNLQSHQENLGVVEDERRLLMDERDTLALETDRLRMQHDHLTGSPFATPPRHD